MEKIYNKVKEFNNKKNIFKYMSLEKDLEIMTNTKMDIARNEGITLGRQQGFDFGLEQGYNNGKIETVLSMLKHKMSINDISEITGLDSNYIKSLQQ